MMAGQSDVSPPAPLVGVYQSDVNQKNSTKVECNTQNCDKHVEHDITAVDDPKICEAENVPEEIIFEMEEVYVVVVREPKVGGKEENVTSLPQVENVDEKKMKVSLLEICLDYNNNIIVDGELRTVKVIEPGCWVKILSCLCSWRMSCDVLEKVQTARVQDSETWDIEKGSKYTVYKVVVHSGSSSWFIYRRYAEFHKLFESLKKQVPNFQLKLPGKKLFGNNMDPTFIATRQGGLDNFVQKIISQPTLLQLPEVREFFKLDVNLNKQHTKETSKRDDMKSENKLNLGPSERSQSLEEKSPYGGSRASEHRLRSARPTDFEFLRVIGQGSFGKVLLARHKTENKYYAVKVLNKGQVIRKNEAKHIMTERNVLLKTLNHPFLVGLHYSFQTPEKLYFVLDFVNGGELFFHLQRDRIFCETRSRFYAAEMACALGYLHSKGIIYRDLKPENILLDSQGHIVLTDFGLSKEGLLGTDTTKTFCGTPEYLAPEIILKEEYDRSVDWWCLGTVLYEMLFGWPPFYCRDTSKMYDRILNKPLSLKGTISESARDILSKLLEKDKTKRLGSGYGDFEDVQRHSFFKYINWDDLMNKRVKPPFNPRVESIIDLKHIDPEFTKEQIPASIEQICERVLSASVREADEMFAGFSYAPQTTELLA